MTLSVTPSSIAAGHTHNLTLNCSVSAANLSLMTFLQISKVNPGGSLTPLVELIPGAQQPIFLDDELIRRSRVSGNLVKGQGQVYLKVIIPDPVKSDIGEYRCSVSYLDTSHEPGQASVTSSLDGISTVL